MDKENKYYSLIEGLVKKHRKFPGYEAIIEEIIDDVFAHSEVIIKSVDNESVIEAYLEKVISTSIITVPKKMNFNTSAHHRVITSTAPDKVSHYSDIEKSEDIVKPAVDSSTVSDSALEPVSQDVQLDIEQETDSIEQDSLFSELESDAEDIQEESSADEVISPIQNYGEEKADPNLVDKMINTLGNDELESVIETPKEQSLAEDDAAFSDLSNVDDLEVINVVTDENDEEILEVVEEFAEEENNEPELEYNLDVETEDSLPLSEQLDDYDNADSGILPEDTDVEQIDEISLELDSEDVPDAENQPNIVEQEDNVESALEEEIVTPLLTDDVPEEETADILSEDLSEVEDLSEQKDTDIVEVEVTEPEQLFDNEETVTLNEAELDINDNESVSLSLSEQSENIEIEPQESEALEISDLSVNTGDDLVQESREENSLDVLSADDEEQEIVSVDNFAVNIDGGEDISGADDLEPEMLSLNDELVDLSIEPEPLSLVSEDVVLSESDNIEPVENEDFPELELSDDNFAVIEENGLEPDVEPDGLSEIVSKEEVFNNENSEISDDSEEDEKTTFNDEYIDNFSLNLPENSDEKKELCYKPTDYSVFDYSPEAYTSGFNTEVLTDKLIQLNQNHPELSVLPIFDLKYKQEMTIDEIAAKLNIDKNQVIMTLNAIIELV